MALSRPRAGFDSPEGNAFVKSHLCGAHKHLFILNDNLTTKVPHRFPMNSGRTTSVGAHRHHDIHPDNKVVAKITFEQWTHNISEGK